MGRKAVITIGRQYGSGGKIIGEKLAKELGIPFYDKELLNVAAEKSGMCKEMFEHHDEKPTNSFLYSLVMGSYNGDNLPLNHKLFLAQFDAIRSIAEQGSCVIIGRCADYALEDYTNCINVFVHADIEERIKRAVNNYGLSEHNAREAITKIDKKRASYYNFYAGRKWGGIENYHITIDSGFIGIDNSVKLLKDFVEMYENFLDNKYKKM